MVFTNIDLATIENYNPKKNGYLYCLSSGPIMKNKDNKKGKIYENEKGDISECTELVFSQNEISSFHNQKLEFGPSTTVKCDLKSYITYYSNKTHNCQICDSDSSNCE